MDIKRLLLIVIWVIISVLEMAQNGIINEAITNANTNETLIVVTFVLQ